MFPARPLLLIHILSAFAFAAHVADANASHAPGKVPPGFEDLWEGQDEQVEVVLYGRSLGLFLARVRPEHVQFDAPEDILAKLGLDESADPAIRSQIGAALQAELPRHGHLVCDGSGVRSDTAPPLGLADDGAVLSCNHIDPPRAAIIFDESRQVAQLFLARAWVDRLPDVAPQEISRYHRVTANAENALIHRQSINWSTSKGRQRNVSANGVGALGLTERGHLGGAWNFSSYQSRYSQGNRFELESLYFRQDVGDAYYVQAGRMDQRNLASREGGSFGFTLLPLPRFHGARIGTTQAYVNPNAVDNATAVTVMLTAPARVEVYRATQLLSTQYLTAGVQRIDTRPLPEGSYLLTLKVVENGAQTRREEVPFSKTGGGFDARSTQWFIQGGQTLTSDRRFQRTQRSQVVQLGGKTGLFDTVVLSSGVAAMNRKFYNETRLEWQTPLLSGTLNASASLFGGTDGSRGNTQSLSYYNGISVSLYRYQMREPSANRRSAVSIGNYDSLSATVSAPLGQWSLNIGYSYSKTLGRPIFGNYDYRDSDEPFRRRNVHRNREYGRDHLTRAIQVGASRSFLVNGMNLYTRLGGYRSTSSRSRGADNGVYLGVSLSASSPPTESGRSGSTSAGIHVQRRKGQSDSINYHASQSWAWQGNGYRQLSVGVGGYRDERFRGHVRGMVDGRYGRLDASVDQAYDLQRHGRSGGVSGSYSSSVAVGRSGIYLGGSNGGGSPAAAVAVKVRAAEAMGGETVAEVSGSGRRLILGSGEKALVATLDGYSTGYTNIRDATTAESSGSIALSQGAGEKIYFLLPGKLVTQEVAANMTYTYLGRVLDEQGQPLADAKVLNMSAPALDDQGGFVLETPERMDSLYLVHQGRLVRVPMLVQGKRDVVQYVGEVTAVEIDIATLPEHLRLQSRVVRLLAGPKRNGTVVPDLALQD